MFAGLEKDAEGLYVYSVCVCVCEEGWGRVQLEDCPGKVSAWPSPAER